MQNRVFAALVFTFGLTLLLAVGIAAGANPDLASAGSTGMVRATQDLAILNQTSQVTSTIYLPAILKAFMNCSVTPILLAPPDGSNLDNLIPLFRLDNGSNPQATLVRLQVARDPGFTDQVSVLSSSQATGIVEFRMPRNLDPTTTYYWRAWLMCGEIQGPYSEVLAFTTAGSGGAFLPAPTLIAPPDESTLPSLPATFQWSAVTGAVEYLICWRELGQVGYSFDWVTETDTDMDWFKAGTTYEWWVQARNDYALGDSSEIWQFTTPAGSLRLPLSRLNHPRTALDQGVAVVK
jgi:hypothetical protein